MRNAMNKGVIIFLRGNLREADDICPAVKSAAFSSGTYNINARQVWIDPILRSTDFLKLRRQITCDVG